MLASDWVPFLRVPPFPGSKPAAPVLRTSESNALESLGDVQPLIDRIVELRVGGSYWGAQPKLPEQPYTLVRVRDPALRAQIIASLADRRLLLAEALPDPTDPWHLVGSASEVVVESGDQLAVIAMLAGVNVRCVGDGPFSSLERGGRAALHGIIRVLAQVPFHDPFTGERLPFADAVELCGFWRGLIDSNRSLAAAIGFASWKRATVAPLLWDGSSKSPFARSAGTLNRGDRIAVWKSRTRPPALAQLERSGAELVEVEDGFIRSAGLGSNCVPPLSIVVDRLGIYFDPAAPSELERLLEEEIFTAEELQRARRLRELIVELGIGKYGAVDSRVERRRSGTRQLLVVGQVEDDRAVTSGAGPSSNLDLLRRVREANGDAWIVYKPHPDVEAGHRPGAIADDICLTVADEIVRDAPIGSLIAEVDEVNVNTSLAGFEALLRGKPVTTHGVPFYAGWGLTRDLARVPARRTVQRSLDELVSAALLRYPRYLDPVTHLPCPPEILVRRLGEARAEGGSGPLVRLRRLQGRWNKAMSSIRAAG